MTKPTFTRRTLGERFAVDEGRLGIVLLVRLGGIILGVEEEKNYKIKKKNKNKNKN